MNRKAIARTLLMIFVAQLLIRCSDKPLISTVEDALLNQLSARLAERDYVSLGNGYTNPYEELGKQSDKIYKDLLSTFRYQLTGDNSLHYGYAVIRQDLVRHEKIKKMARMAIERNNSIFSDRGPDLVYDKLQGYKFTSEDMQRFFDNAVNDGSLKPVERAIIVLELRAIVESKTDLRQREILQTVEYEVSNSSIDESSKNKILLINTIGRNLLNSQGIGPLNGYGFNLFSESPFQQTTPVAIASFFLTFIVVSLIVLFTDPNCDAACQQQMVASIAIYGALAMLVCDPSVGTGCPPCLPPCFFDTDNNCIGYPCDDFPD
jgi:hypothetical protein